MNQGYRYIRDDKNGVWGIYRNMWDASGGDYQRGSGKSTRVNVAVATDTTPPAAPKPAKLPHMFTVIEKYGIPLAVQDDADGNVVSDGSIYHAGFARDLGISATHAIDFDVHYLPNDSYNRQAWAIPERDGRTVITGWNLRYMGNDTGMKRTHGPRGIFYAAKWNATADFHGVFCPEGFSDTLALHAMGLPAVGRPNNVGGVKQLAQLFADSAAYAPLASTTPIYILGENDRKQDGSWPGLSGAIHTAQSLADKLMRPVYYVLPPDGAKDVREWYTQQTANHPDKGAAAIARKFHRHCQSHAIIRKPGDALPAAVTVDLAVAGSNDLLSDTDIEYLEREETTQRELFLKHRAAIEAEISSNPQAAANHAQPTNPRSLSRRKGCGIVRTQAKVTSDCQCVGHGIETRCGGWYNCAFCRYLNQLDHKAHFQSILSQMPAAYIATLPQEEATKAVDRIRRHAGGRYKMVQQPGGMAFILSNMEFPGSTETDSHDAIPLTRRAIDNIPRYPDGDRRHPVSSSRGWKVPKPEPRGLIDLGVWGESNLDELQEFISGFSEVRLLHNTGGGSGGLGAGNLSTSRNRTITDRFGFTIDAGMHATASTAATMIDNLKGWLFNNSGLCAGEWSYPASRSLRDKPPDLIAMFARGRARLLGNDGATEEGSSLDNVNSPEIPIGSELDSNRDTYRYFQDGAAGDNSQTDTGATPHSHQEPSGNRCNRGDRPRVVSLTGFKLAIPGLWDDDGAENQR